MRQFWLAVEDRLPHETLAALACPPELPRHTWIRLFSARSQAVLSKSFGLLLEKACAELPRGMFLTGIGLFNWFTELLIEHFQVHQHIVILEWHGELPAPRVWPPGLRIRPMELDDLDEVHRIDNLAFEALWQNSREEVLRSLVQSSYSSVAELDRRIIGYQISTGSFFNAHLARLAIHPDLQRLSIGYLLVEELLQHFQRQAYDRITVNTQHDNAASLALYKKIGFELTGESFPVYIREV
jgi:ribosomal-protein-alanine N-acetyltransferase